MTSRIWTSASRSWVLLATLIVAGALISTTSCKKPGAEQPRFPHAKHAELGVACADCHGAQGGTLPTVETCKTCHSEALENVTPEQVAKMVEAYRHAPVAYGLIFSHPKHEGVGCDDCHKTATGTMARPKMDFCLTACHGVEAQMPLTCEKCHTTLDALGQPATHSTGWRRMHGPTASAESTSCKDCHTQETCFSCHQTAKPADHNSAWRLRLHGVVAQADRERCASCHRQDFWATCHESTKPINHTSSWLGVRSNAGHCRNCHLPIQNNRCATCHFTGAGHPSAPAWPVGPTHVSGADCRACHIGPGQKLEHPDNGDNCETCHAK
jgi:hypothetical protein